MLSDFFNTDWLKSRFSSGDWWPAVNVADDADSYTVEIAAPGFKKQDFQVTVNRGVLTVSAKSEKEDQEKKKQYTRQEFSSRSFSQSLQLPGNVDEENVSATYAEGVLTLHLNKSGADQENQKKIEVH